jgi:hypothetical protein
LTSGDAPGYVATDRLLIVRSCGAVAKPMPEAAAAKKPHAEATKFTLVAHHKECTTPF